MEGGPNIQEADNIISSSVEEHVESKSVYHLCNPNGKLHRFIALIFMCFLGFGSYFCYDNPAALENHMKTDLNITLTEYAMFYSMYSWPNVFLCFVGGFLIDRVFGIRLGTIIFMVLTLWGQLIFALGGLFNLYWLMLIGRFVFGIGGESLAVAQNNYAVLWFKGKELNMVFGLQLSFARIGSSANMLAMEPIYKWVTKNYEGHTGLGIALLIALTTCFLSLFCALILGWMDKRAEVILRRHETASQDVVRLTDVVYFKETFWLISVICVTYYVAIFPFIGLGNDFFVTKFHMTTEEANTVNSIVYLVSLFASPVLGLLIDKIGKNISWIMAAVSTTILAHSLLAFTAANPYVGMVLMGISYSCLASSLWPLVSLIIPEYQLGTAYGVCQAVQNFGLAVFTYVAGVIAKQYGYTWSETFFISSLCVALTTSILLWLLDMYKGGNLNMTSYARREQQSPDEDTERLLESDNANQDAPDGRQPNTDFQIRNRYLSRIGAPLPNHYSIETQGLIYESEMNHKTVQLQ